MEARTIKERNIDSVLRDFEAQLSSARDYLEEHVSDELDACYEAQIIGLEGAISALETARKVSAS